MDAHKCMFLCMNTEGGKGDRQSEAERGNGPAYAR